VRKRIQRPSPALVVACISLFVALGGVGYAAATINGADIKNKTVAGKKLKNKTVTGGKVKADTLTGTQINESKLGRVPSATNAEKAKTADSATTASVATTATTATTLAGKDAASFAPAKAEAVRIVGAPGQPPFEGTWDAAGSEQVPGFWKDPFGTVYLQGQAGRTGSDSVIFTLPEGYRPTENSYFSTYPSGGEGTVAIAVNASGNVNLFGLAEPGDDGFVGLGGIVFRAAGS